MYSFFSHSILVLCRRSIAIVMELSAVLASFGNLVRGHETPSESEPVGAAPRACPG